ncbi:uncharacterized protein LOC129588919 isoform X2 [Paramacrobiotus metropolitanus]|uniref:uncharacterized protein LOC129588919 isoform X2 n=1 Tax=Paramacrobiotus metropolitanus TaxID=2943436 RepID=UPI0024464A7A|nr:uncharacterized protein LOC129588919 isoform X2 [Paramacrobiotus metropolitanus]
MTKLLTACQQQIGESCTIANCIIASYNVAHFEQCLREVLRHADFNRMRFTFIERLQGEISNLIWRFPRLSQRPTTVAVLRMNARFSRCFIYSVQPVSCQVITHSEINFGGNDIDMTVFNYCLDEFRNNHFAKSVRFPRSSLQRLLQNCERGKIALSSSRCVMIRVESFYRRIDLAVTLTRATFNHLILDRCLDIVRQFAVKIWDVVWPDIGKISPLKTQMALEGLDSKAPIFSTKTGNSFQLMPPQTHDKFELFLLGKITRIPLLQRLTRTMLKKPNVAESTIWDELVIGGLKATCGSRDTGLDLHSDAPDTAPSVALARGFSGALLSRNFDAYGSTCTYHYDPNTDWIGQGSFGAVYKATIQKRGDFTGSNTVAVKKMFMANPKKRSAAWETDGSFGDNMHRWKTLLTLNHERLVSYHKIVHGRLPTGGETLEIMMDYFPDGDLAGFIDVSSRSRESFSVTNVVNFGRQIAEDGQIVMAQGETCTKDVTHIHGTARYMSPEMVRTFLVGESQKPGRKTDIWSLGCVLVELLDCHYKVEETWLCRKVADAVAEYFRSLEKVGISLSCTKLQMDLCPLWNAMTGTSVTRYKDAFVKIVVIEFLLRIYCTR